MKIMFVCHGNICRSPMAEIIMRDLVERAGLSERIAVASSATSTEEIYRGIGNPIYPPAERELKKHGLSAFGKRAVRLTRADGYEYDMLVCMDSNNLRNIKQIIDAQCYNKVYKLMDFTEKGGDVADPWYTDRFDITYKDILEGCIALLSKIKKGTV